MLRKLNGLPKRWLLVVAATALLSVGLTAGVIAAAGFDGAGTPIGGKTDYAGARGGMLDEDDRLLRRLAEIVNVDAATLANAFDTALNELANEKFAEKMNELVADGTLTAEQSATAVAWFNARPANVGHIAYMGVMTDNTDRLAQMLAEGVEHGALAQTEADAIIAWHGARPDFIPAYDGGMHDGHRKGKHHRRGDRHDSRHTEGSNTDDSAVGDANPVVDTDAGAADDSAADTDSATNDDAADSGS